MIRKNTIFDFMTSVLMIFGISVISICVFTFLFGENAKEISTIFALGKNGIPLTTLIQFLIMAFIITAMKWIFFTDKLIKNLSIAFRTVLMFLSIIILIVVFAALFQWFPINMAAPWIMFFICFAVFAAASIVISTLKEKSENEKMQEALERLRQEDLQ